MKSESKQNKMDVKTFRELFVHRDDVHAIQQPKGTYLPVKEAVTDADIEAHLEGRTTLGLYQVKPEVNTITWAGNNSARSLTGVLGKELIELTAFSMSLNS